MFLNDDPFIVLGRGNFGLDSLKSCQFIFNKRKLFICVSDEFGNVVGKKVLKISQAAYVFSTVFDWSWQSPKIPRKRQQAEPPTVSTHRKVGQRQGQLGLQRHQRREVGE